jgi:DNA-binding transcriptional LysR family regulator
METQYFRTLCAVLDCGSFSKAAGRLNITQSAVSQRIRLLEERYGTALLDRNGPTVQPTPAGLIVRHKGEQILALEQEMERDLGSLGNKRRLSLCSTPTFGIVYLPRVLNRFLLFHSGDVDLAFAINTPEQSLQGLLNNDFDLAVIEHCGPLEGVAAAATPLPPDELVFISAPSLGLPSPDISLDDLLGQRLIARREGCSSRCLLQENLARFGRKLTDFNGMIIYDDLHLTIQTVQEGRGVAFVSKTLAEELIREGKLRGHAVDGFRCIRSRTLLLNRSRSEEPLLREFVATIEETFTPRNSETAGDSSPYEG